MCVWYKDGEDEAWSDLGLWGDLPLASNDQGVPANSANSAAG
jgi:hypothetical protein